MLVNPADEVLMNKHSASNQQPSDVVKPAILNKIILSYQSSHLHSTFRSSSYCCTIVCLHYYNYNDPLNLGRIGLHTLYLVTEFED